MKPIHEKEYQKLFEEVKHEFLAGRITAIRAINREQIARYFSVGQKIIERQEQYGWGKSIVERLASDLQKQFPNDSGFSTRNLWNMRRFYEQYSAHPNLQQLVAEIPWGHNLLIMSKANSIEEAEFYIKQTTLNGWSRNVLLNFIKADTYNASLVEKKQHNFAVTLPEHLAEQAEETIRSEYSLDFLGITKPVKERELENKMIENIRDVLLALGYGFAYMGNQYKIKLGRNEYFIDLLFYHRHLQCMVAVELKAGKFEPSHAAQLNYYLEVLDDTVKQPHENPSIGILLCAEKDNLEVEYALRISNKPIGVAEYSLTKKLPKNLKKVLPEANEIRKLLK
ncbi:PDDEXK nuclease domain-containing protein [Parapedobacter tibetensis]|uniref:PDDEXK nuclease domain-containing protein n=1 Tax=Parapedobacter tibetensis TaxID=2972951 RepID=UPI00214D2587|nr:PDDEXK nuclease domain-containing protein [Parapedobacter tibetensis]